MLFLFLLNAVASLTPDRGLETGETTVTLTGDFLPTSGLDCKFGDYYGTATYFNISRVDCQSPSGSGSVTVTYSLDGSNYQSAGTFLYYSVPSVSSISPSSGPEAAATQVLFSVDAVLASDSIEVKLADVYVTSCSYVSSTKFSCYFPSFEVLQLVDSSVSPDDISLAVSRNGVQFTSITPTFDYYLAHSSVIETFKISPTHGSASGGTLITATLQSSVLSSGSVVSCKFGSVEVSGTVVDSQSFTCTSPAKSR